MLGLANPDLLATQMAGAGIGPEVMAPQLGLGGLIQPGQIPMPGAAAQMAATSPVPQQMGGAQVASRGGNVFEDFMRGVQSGGVTNPNALRAIAATGHRESRFSPTNAHRTWDDLGQPAGGVMSWRDNRLNNLMEFAGSADMKAISPEIQGKFFVDEAMKTGLLDRLNAAQTPEDAMREMNRAWAFKGFDDPNSAETQARFAALKEVEPLVGGLNAGGTTTGSTIDFARAGDNAGATPAITQGGTATQDQATGGTSLFAPVGGGVEVGDGGNTGSSGSNTAQVMNAGGPTEGGQKQTLGQRLAALGKGMGGKEAFNPTPDKTPQAQGSAPQVGGGFNRDPQAIAQMMALLGGAAAGVQTPSLAAMLQPRR